MLSVTLFELCFIVHLLLLACFEVAQEGESRREKELSTLSFFKLQK